MRATRFGMLAALFVVAADLTSVGRAAAADAIEFRREPGKVLIHIARKPFATYVYDDKEIPRPHFRHVFSPGGIQVTRHQPPVPGKDAVDHPTFHPGIWLAFGDLNGSDSWRSRAPVRHEKFLVAPRNGAKSATFTVGNQYLANDGKTLIARETCHYAISVRPAGILLVADSTFHPENGPLKFGDQEEMGLGIRVATPLAVKGGGSILNSLGRTNEAKVWGRQADWCDYGGVIDGRRVGMVLLPDPDQFRRSWFHARDYGVLVANPFGLNAFTKEPKKPIVVAPGKTLRLRFGVLVYDRDAKQAADHPAIYRDFLEQLRAGD